MEVCPKHPEEETMIPCLGCGRYFCRICHPPKGAGQYCPRCYRESLSKLSEKEGEKPSFFTSVAIRFRRVTVERKPEERRQEGPDKPVTVEKAAVGGEARPVRTKALRERARGAWGSLSSRAGAAGAAVRRMPGRGFEYARARFPLGLTDKEGFEGMPPLAKSWYKLAAFTLGGSALWIALVAIFHQRNPAFSIVTAIIVAWGIAWSLGNRFDLPVAVVAVCLVLLSLMIGEIVVQLLYRGDVIRINLPVYPDIIMYERRGVLYGNFYRDLLLHRLLPSVAAAFLIGWWPLPRRVTWRGFSPRSAEEAFET